MIYTVGDISGAHLNPAVTISFWVAKVFLAEGIIPYVIRQAVGAFLASISLKYLFPANALLGTEKM